MRNQAILDTHPDASFINGDEVLDINYKPIELNEDLIQERLSVLSIEASFVVLRNKRDELLFQTDWRMTSDYPYNDQAAWASYRTALRNLPATATPTLDEQGNLIVDWPQAPDAV